MWFVRSGETPQLWSGATIELDDAGGSIDVSEQLPGDLPLGAHRLQPLDGGPETRLMVVPRAAPRPSRGWGWSTQLYATRSASSWGLGDLVDLSDLAVFAQRSGAQLLAHNPLGAALPISSQQPSPYYASTRRFWSPLYLRIESVLGAELAADAVARSAAIGRELDESPLIDRDRVWEQKLAALEAVWSAVRATDALRHELAAVDSDHELTRYATFCAIAEHHRSGWSQWPAALHHPDAPEVTAFGAAHGDRVDFFRWLQVEADAQLAAASGAGAGLMADLPVGFDPVGFDAWTDQDLLALGCSIGAPPDDFSPSGQDWGLPPYVPWKLRAAGYQPWIDTLRRVFRHCSALRIDHVMGLFRLFWIPNGAEGGHGAYVHHHGTELLDLAIMEAARAGAVLVGEDLGTVEEGVRTALAERDVFGYRIGWFAEDPPEEWPETTLGALTTHDLPTVAGLWSGQDAADRARAGAPPDPDGDALLRSRLVALSEHGAGSDEHSDAAAETGRPVVLDAHAALARSGSDLVVATLEDAVGVRTRPNLPGTLDEHPNWRLALPVPLDDLGPAGADELAGVMNEGREQPRTLWPR